MAPRSRRAAVAALQEAGLTARRIPVSHAFHTSIVAPVSGPLTDALRRLELRPPASPIVSNVTGHFYPADADVETMLDLLGRQVASPVQFVAGLRTLYDAGARVFVEVGPKKALHGFVEDVLGAGHDDVMRSSPPTTQARRRGRIQPGAVWAVRGGPGSPPVRSSRTDGDRTGHHREA